MPSVIAIVDDDESVRRALRRLVRSLRYEPVVFASGEEFLASLPAGRPDCVLMDLHLPGLNDIETLERLRQRDHVLPVIVMTGFDQAGTRARCLSAGASAYITKPVDGAALTAAIRGRTHDADCAELPDRLVEGEEPRLWRMRTS